MDGLQKSWAIYLMFLTDVSMFNIWTDSKCMGWWTYVDLKKKKKQLYYRKNNQRNTF